MNKKILLATITVFFLLEGCGKATPANTGNQNVKSPSAATTTNSSVAKSTDTTAPAATNSADAKSTVTTTTPAAKIATSDNIDYNQYIKKIWVVKSSANNGVYENSSFCISKIVNGEITGYFVLHSLTLPNRYTCLPGLFSNFASLTGKINKDTAECQFSDKDGNKGTIKLLFKTKNEIDATIKFTAKSKIYKNLSLDGNFQFIPYKLANMKELSIFKDQSFTVDLNSWGNVRFVSGKALGGNHIPILFYLTDKDGAILYDFTPDLPYSVDAKAVSFRDVNKDGLKDIIIIVVDAYNIPKGTTGGSIATVYFQKTNGSFENDHKLDQEINDSKNNKDIKSINNFLSKKF